MDASITRGSWKSLVLFLLIAGMLCLMLNSISCVKSPTGDDPADSTDTTDTTDTSQVIPVELIAPYWFPAQKPVPVAVQLYGINKRSFGWKDATISFEDGNYFRDINIKRGGASLQVLPSRLDEQTVFLDGNTALSSASRRITFTDETNIMELEGQLADSALHWEANSLIHVVGDITIPGGVILQVDSGVVCLLDNYVSIHVQGEMHVQGSNTSPVTFTSYQNDAPWGEIYFDWSLGQFEYVFFTNGGGDSDKPFGHSNSQPVIHSQYASIAFNRCYFLDNPGKALGTFHSIVQIDSSIISRCDTGGEHQYGKVTVRDSWLLDMPDNTSEEIDDDNDCIYLNNPYNDDTEGSLLQRCVFATGKDDGIDHNGAILRIESCIIEDFDNEGVATSNQNRVDIYNTLVMNCEQGIEAGYGAPEVHVDHCVMLNNETGLRFGDWYTWGDPSGSIEMTNSISVNNTSHNVWNWIVTTEQPKPGAISISYSIVNDSSFNYENGNLFGEVQFNNEYTLAPGSLGAGAANDNNDMGLLPAE